MDIADRLQGKRRDIGLGGASCVSLADAREAAQRMRGIARQGGEPVTERNREPRQTETGPTDACSKNYATFKQRGVRLCGSYDMIDKGPHTGILAHVLMDRQPDFSGRPKIAKRCDNRL